jgi:dihydrofolate synthase/folylpolyglutamate synthase
MFYKEGEKALKYDLSNIQNLCEVYHFPYSLYKTIHVAGTNGKGSVSHQVASILQSAGYKVGLYSSPHIIDFRERIKVNGQMIDRDFVVDFVSNSLPLWEKFKPSFFELTTLMAFEYFAKKEVDVAVIETGLGGRLDSTNIITPVVSVITNVSFDHTEILGDTLEKIAREKAGIIKPNVPVIIGETHAETKDIFLDKALSENAPISFADELYHLIYDESDYRRFKFTIYERRTEKIVFVGESDLIGFYQRKNILTTFCTTQTLIKLGFDISEKNISEGFKHVKKNTELIGRWQILKESPLIICDSGHNPSGIEEVAKQLRAFENRKIHIVLGFSRDKDIDAMLNIFKYSLADAIYYFTRFSTERSKDEKELAQMAAERGLKGMPFSNIREAFESALKNAQNNDVIFIGGSNYLLGEFFKECKSLI